MHIRNTAENVFLALQKYRNWPEVVTLSVKGQNFYKVVLKNGVQIESPTGLQRLMREIFFWKAYTPTNLHIGRNDIVVDIGAHHGVFALFAASLTQNTIYAFEPSSRNFESLTRNIRVNGLNHVIAYNIAVSDKIGSTKILLDPTWDKGHILSDNLVPEKLEKYRQDTRQYFFDPDKLDMFAGVEVSTTTLQDIIDRHNLARIDFLKLDCEGSEGPILHAAPKEYLMKVQKIALEFHDHLSQYNHNDIQKLLQETGFTTRLKLNNNIPLGYLYAWRH